MYFLCTELLKTKSRSESLSSTISGFTVNFHKADVKWKQTSIFNYYDVNADCTMSWL